MAKTYYTVLTTYGAQLFAQAMANRQQVRITQFAVGDGNGRAVQPDSARTSLVRQVHRANISAISNDPRNNRQVIFELTIPENVGGFWIREMGIYDNNNRLVAYANCPDTYKPQLSEGSGKIQVVRMILLVSSSNAVTLSVDDSVIFVTRGQLTPKNITATSQNSVSETGHTHHIDKATTTQAGITQLADNLTTNDNTKALTAAQGKALNEAKADKTLTIQVENAIYNRGSVDDLLGQNKLVPINGGDRERLGFKPEMYNFGLVASLGAGQAKILMYAPHSVGQLWIRNTYGNSKFEWKRVDGADWSEVRNKPTTLDGYGTTSNQPLTINNPSAHLKGQREGTNQWFVGLANGETNDVQLHAYQSGNSLILKADRTESSKPLYVGNSKVFTESNLSPAKNIDLSATIPDTEIAYQDATPSQLPMGTYFGLSRNSRLNGELYSGWSMISRILNGGYAVRFGVNAGVLSYQDGDSGGWNSVKTVLNNEDLVNNLTTNDNSKVLTAAQGKVLNEAKADKATTLAGYGITDAVNVNALTGAVMYFAMTTPPEGWLKADGRAVSRTTYAALFARIGTTFGAGDGRTTFNLPDLRGEFIRGWDNRRGVDRERSFGSFQFASMQPLTSSGSEYLTGITNKDNNSSQIWSRAQHDKITQGSRGYQDVKVSYMSSFSWHDRNQVGLVNNGNNAVEFGAVRPRNVALLACIKY